jgi:hypothetical protein
MYVFLNVFPSDSLHQQSQETLTSKPRHPQIPSDAALEYVKMGLAQLELQLPRPILAGP